LNQINETRLRIRNAEWITVTKRGKTETSFHINVETPGKQKIEIVVRNQEEAGRKRKCEIFGDELKGLDITELERVLQENPAQKFIPP
jgi:predicted nucleotidyltransferase